MWVGCLGPGWDGPFAHREIYREFMTFRGRVSPIGLATNGFGPSINNRNRLSDRRLIQLTLNRCCRRFDSLERSAAYKRSATGSGSPGNVH